MPAAFGTLLILAGLLVIVFPRMLQWTIGGMLILVGAAVVATSLGMGSRVTYRRVDAAWHEQRGE